MSDRMIADRREGIGLRLPERNSAHEHAQWYELDLDDEVEDPDVQPIDPLPTERHRRVPGMS